MHRSLRAPLLLVVLWLLALPLAAQDAPDLTAEDVAIETRVDVYGLENTVAAGSLVNNGAQALSGVTVLADVYAADDTLIGEGFGYLVNACGAGLLPDYTLQPGHAQPFEVILELYEQDAAIDRVDIRADGRPVESTVAADPTPGITQVTDTEVVAVEWLDTRALRYAVGCARNLFTDWDWFHYSGRTRATLPVVHPRAAGVTQQLIDRMNVTEPGEIGASMLQFAPTGTRLVYQGEINRFYTAEADGTFQRVIYDHLYNRTLQGIQWLGGDVFLAYYYGASGDPVYYFTATAAGQPISLHPNNLPLSRIVPGVSPDGRRAVLAGTFDDQTGYFLQSLVNDSSPQLLFEAEPPGNNWPAPLFQVVNGADAGSVAQDRVFFARPVGGEARLFCYNLQNGGPVDLAPLPLTLGLDERASWWLSPDGATIALAANGARGGLWLIDLTALPACAA